MLKKTYRLNKGFLKNPKVINSKNFILKTTTNDLQVSRFAFILSKKVDKRAASRNLLRRKVRSCVEEIFDRIETGHDFVFYPRKSGIEVSRVLLFKEIKELFTKEGYLR